MVSSAMLLWSVLFGSIGIGYLVYGRKQKHIPAFVSGILLLMLPYFVASTMPIVVIGILLMALPYLAGKVNL